MYDLKVKKMGNALVRIDGIFSTIEDAIECAKKNDNSVICTKGGFFYVTHP